jgi:hypothetical protein
MVGDWYESSVRVGWKAPGANRAHTRERGPAGRTLGASLGIGPPPRTRHQRRLTGDRDTATDEPPARSKQPSTGHYMRYCVQQLLKMSGLRTCADLPGPRFFGRRTLLRIFLHRLCFVPMLLVQSSVRPPEKPMKRAIALRIIALCFGSVQLEQVFTHQHWRARSHHRRLIRRTLKFQQIKTLPT